MAQGLRIGVHAPQHVTNVDPDTEPLIRPPGPSQFALGLRAGARGLASSIGRAGEAVGLETAEFAEEQEELAQEAASGARVESIRDVSSPSEAVDWAAFTLGELVPSVVASASGGGAGGLLARAVIGGTRATAVGTAAGAFGASAVPQAGSIFQEIREESGIEAPGAAFAGGAAAGALDILPQARLLRRFTQPATRTGLGREVLTQAGTEAATEAAQESIALGTRAAVDPTFDPLAEENLDQTINRLIEAGAAGALGGTAGGALAFGASRLRPSPDRTGQATGLPPPGGAVSQSRALDEEILRSEAQRDEALDPGEVDEMEGRLEVMELASRAASGPGTFEMINSTEFFKGAALTPQARKTLGLSKLKPKKDSLLRKLNEMNERWFRENPDQTIDPDVQPYRIATALEQAEEEAIRAFPYDANLRRRYIEDFAQGVLDDKEGVTAQRRYADALASRERAAARGDQEALAAADQAIEQSGAQLERIQPVNYRSLGERDGQFDARQFLRQFHTIAGATTQQPDVDLTLARLPKQRSGKGFERNVSWKAQRGQPLKAGEFVAQQEGGSDRIVNLPNLLSTIRKQGFKPAQRAGGREPDIHEKLADELSTAAILLNDQGWMPGIQTLGELIDIIGPDTVVRRGSKNQAPITLFEVVERGLFTNPRVYQDKNVIGLERMMTKPEHLTDAQWEAQKAAHQNAVSGVEAQAQQFADAQIAQGSTASRQTLVDQFWDEQGGRIAFDPREMDTLQGEGLESLPEQVSRAQPPETDVTGLFVGEPPGLTRQETFRPGPRDTRVVAQELEDRLNSARTLAQLVAIEDEFLGSIASRLEGPLGPPGRSETPPLSPRPVREQIRDLRASVKRLRRNRPSPEAFARVPGSEESFNELLRGEEQRLAQAEWEARIGKQVRSRLQAEVKRLRDPRRGPQTERARPLPTPPEPEQIRRIRTAREAIEAREQGIPTRESSKYQTSETIGFEERDQRDRQVAQRGEWTDDTELRQSKAEQWVEESREDKSDAIRLNRQAIPLSPERMPLFERLGDRGTTDAAEMVETLGLDPDQVEFVTPERTAWFLDFLRQDMGRAELVRSIERGSTQGVSIMVRNRRTGAPKVFVWARGDLDTDLFTRILAHEMGHAFEYLRASEIPANVQKAILDEYTAWRQKFQDPNTQVLDLLRSKKGDEAALLGLLGTGRRSGFDTDIELGELSDAAQEYALSFNEWWADRVSEWMHRPASEAKTPVERFFAALADALRKLFRQYPVDRTIDDYLASLHGTARRWSHPTSAIDIGRVANPGQGLPHEYRRGIARLSRGVLDDDPDDIAHAAWLDSNQTIDGEMWSAWVGDVWPALSPDVRSSLGRLALSAPIQSQLRRLLATDPQALVGIREPKVAAAYAYQFWRAGDLNINPEMDRGFTSIRDVFFKVVRYIANEDGELGNPGDVEESLRVFDALRETRMRVDPQDTRYTSRRTVTNGAGDVARNWAEAFDRFSRIGSSLFSTLDTQLRSTGNPALQQLANSFYKVTGRISTESGFWQARNMRIGEFTNQARGIFEGVEDLPQFMDFVYGARDFDQAPAEWQDSIRELRSLMRSMLEYQREAGVNIRDLGKDYFPWVLDLERLENDRQPFFDVINQPKYFEDRVDVAVSVNKRQLRAQADRAGKELTQNEIESIAEDYARTVSPLIPAWVDLSELIDETQVADYIYNGALNSNGNADVVVDLVNQAPTMRFMNTRLLKFVEPQEIRQFLSDDGPQSVLSYIYQAVKHAEYSRRFGEDNSKLDQLMIEAREFGATLDDFKLADNAVKANLGTYGRERAQWLHDNLGIALPEPGAPINDTLQRAMGGMLVFQNLKYLGLATITSLVDPLGIGVRGSSVSMALRSMMTAVRESVRREPTELTDLASMLGLIEQGGTNEAISWRFEGEYMKGMAKTVNDKWFQVIGLDAWTRMTRLAATSAAQSFLRKHTQKPNRHSARYLEELNLFEGDIQFQDNGMIRVLDPAERREASPEELARDNRVRSAIAQFVDEAILRPNPMQRTLWGSDPHFILFQHLKSFMYSFYVVILKRAAVELGNHNFYSLMTLGMFIPAMMAATALRDLIKYGEDGNPYKSDWTTWNYMQDAAFRSGLYGYLGTLGEDVSTDIDYGGYGIGGMFSTLASTLGDIDDILTLEDEALIRQLPGSAIYNNWVQ